MTSNGPSIIAGTARLDGEPVMVIGHERAERPMKRIERNFGMPQPEDYRKAMRLMQFAERFRMPIITLMIRQVLILALAQKSAIKVKLLHEIYSFYLDLKHPLFARLLVRVALVVH